MDFGIKWDKMSRSKGAKDKKRRKTRSDKVHEYRKKSGRFVRYIPKKDKDADIKIWWWERLPMSKDGIMNWNKRMRGRLHKEITRFGVRVDVSPERISTEDNIKDLAAETVAEPGVFLMMGFGHGKNKMRVKPVKLAKVVIKESAEGFNIKVTETWRLKMRYRWLWKGD